nr:hypothetical protein GCM10020092_078140 [Actinoplanes digitatis]
MSVGVPTTPGKRGATLSAGAKAAVPSSVRVKVLDHATAQKRGHALMLEVGRADGKADAGKVNVFVDYGKFREAYGAGWADRIRLVELLGMRHNHAG